MKLTKEQEELKAKIREASREASRAWSRWYSLKVSCSCYAIEDRGGVAVCLICGNFYGRYCENSPNKLCNYGDGRTCLVCGKDVDFTEDD